VTPLALNEIANDVVHILPQDFTIREDAIDRLRDAAQTFGPFLVTGTYPISTLNSVWVP
jgi:hypothetical protein